MAIVDDEANVVATYELLFKRRKIPISFTALDGCEALEKFKNADPKPTIIIIDYRIPSMDGMELMKAVLAVESHTKIIIISGDDSIKQDVLEAGAHVFLKKPVSIKNIMENVNSLLN